MTRSAPRRKTLVAALAVSTALAACSDAATSTEAATAAVDTSAVFDSSTVHEIRVDVDEDDYAAMLETYASTGEKDWIEATVTIDGTTYEQAGVRLKGNSSLRVVRDGTDSQAADSPEELPWLIKLDKYVDDQTHEGVHDFVVRSNNSETALNEAVAVELLEAAGLATQDAIAVRFSVNDGEEALRLVIEHPDDVWMAENLDADGALYKAESTGDYSYRGDDPDAYDEVFDQEAGKDNADLDPLIEFLEFLDDSDDATFAAEIDEWLDVDAFATYLAMQDIVQNFDDIDGPGNNSYLYYDTDEERFTVVAWDHNLAFGDAGFGLGSERGEGPGELPTNDDGRPSPPDGAPAGDGITPPEGFTPPEGVTPDGSGPPDGAPSESFAGGDSPGPGGGGPVGSNVLVDRMLDLEDFADLVERRTAELTAELIDSGMAADIVTEWAEVLERDTSDIVSAATITDEARRLIDGL